jgi:hypothetical protein
MGGLGVTEDGELVPTGHAPRCPEVDDDRVAPVIGESEPQAVEGDAFEWGRRRSDRGGLIGRTAADDGNDEQAGDRPRDRPASTARTDRGGAYWRVNVPVMFAWMLQTNGYTPAGWAGTS